MNPGQYRTAEVRWIPTFLCLNRLIKSNISYNCCQAISEKYLIPVKCMISKKVCFLKNACF
jgi:hypothetical protein